MSKELTPLIEKLDETRDLTDSEFRRLLSEADEENRADLAARARERAEQFYGCSIFTRGLIEFTNVCRNDCYYCGIRRGNEQASRYRLTEEEILACCEQGYRLDFRTFVLQGGEDPAFTGERLGDLVREIKRRYPDCAVTLSVGEWSREDYERWYEAGAERYLLRHETAEPNHYRLLHPAAQSLENRKLCLRTLKEIGYQVGTGIMVGSPGQTLDCLIADFRFMQELMPHMIGIGPFIPHHDTPFRGETAGTLTETLLLLSILRLMFPDVLLPATTALGTIHPRGRELGILAGANVIMPNLSPAGVRGKYLLYDNKICTGEEAAECRRCLARRVESIGYELSTSRGDCCRIEKSTHAERINEYGIK